MLFLFKLKGKSVMQIIMHNNFLVFLSHSHTCIYYYTHQIKNYNFILDETFCFGLPNIMK